MKNNAIISIRFKDMLGILDARENVAIYLNKEDKPMRNHAAVCELLADKEFMKKYGDYFVSGLISFPVTTNILITTERII